MGLAVNVQTGRAVKWPKYPYSTGTDRAEFECVHDGQWWTLASGARHREKKIPQGSALIYREHGHHTKTVPFESIHLSRRL